MCCRSLYSNQGTNFKGFYTEFKTLMRKCKIKEVDCCLKNVDKNYMSPKGIAVNWNFNVPVNPHEGGGWERAI